MTAQTWRGRLAVVGVGLEGLESASPGAVASWRAPR
jgi:hypothetical protein